MNLCHHKNPAYKLPALIFLAFCLGLMLPMPFLGNATAATDQYYLIGGGGGGGGGGSTGNDWGGTGGDGGGGGGGGGSETPGAQGGLCGISQVPGIANGGDGGQAPANAGGDGAGNNAGTGLGGTGFASTGGGGGGGAALLYLGSGTPTTINNGDLGTNGGGSDAGSGGNGGAAMGQTITDGVVNLDMRIQGGGGGQFASRNASGGNGGAVSATRTGDLSVGTNLTIKGGSEGNGSGIPALGNGGSGGDASLTVSGKATIGGELNVTSGAEGVYTTGGAGAASFTAGTLIAPTINLTKQDGALSFTVNTLEIGSSNTTLTATGLAAGDATITNLLLTGDKNFTLAGAAAANVTVGQLMIDGGTLNDANWANLVSGGITYTNSDISMSGTAGATVNINNNQTISRTLVGTSLTKTGTGTLTLTEANTYTGGTTLNQGRINIGHNSALGGGGTLSMANGTTLGFTNNFSLSNAISLTGVGTFDTNGYTATLDGVISGTGSLTKTGAGTLTLSAANTYSGLTEVKAGTLALSSSGTISDQLALYNGTTFIDGRVSPSPITLSRLDVHGSASFQGDLDMAGNTLNFYIPTNMGNGETMLTISGGVSLGSDATVNVGIDGSSSPLQVGDIVKLIDASLYALSGSLANTTSNGQGMHGVTLMYEFDLEADITNSLLTATLTSVGSNEQAKALSEGWLAGPAIVNAGANFVAGKGMGWALGAAGDTGQGFGAFGGIEGDSARYQTGSHVDMQSVSLLAGLAWGADLTPGHLTLGGFLEYGTGSYDTFNSFTNLASVRGNGNTHNFGGGVLGRFDVNYEGFAGLYTEGSFRAGRLHNEYHSNDLIFMGQRAEYNSDSTYYGFHFGGGYIWNFSAKSAIDLYGKYFWTRVQGDSVRLSTGDPVKFGNVDSSRLRLGGRFAYTANEYVSPYVGAAYEHEFDGKARVTTNGFDINAPSMRGGTGIGELGLTIKPSQNLPLSFDLGVQGYMGKREGVTGSLQIKYEF